MADPRHFRGDSRRRRRRRARPWRRPRLDHHHGHLELRGLFGVRGSVLAVGRDCRGDRGRGVDGGEEGIGEVSKLGKIENSSKIYDSLNAGYPKWP